MATSKKYNVGGIALDRPFKMRRLGHFGFNANDLEASRHFYFDLLGFFVTEPAGAGYFGRHAGDHHSFALFDKKRFNRAPIRRGQCQTLSSGERYQPDHLAGPERE